MTARVADPVLMLDPPCLPAGFFLRPVAPADLAALEQQVRDIRRLDDDPTVSPEQVAAMLSDTRISLERDSCAVVDRHGAPVGATFLVPSQETGGERVWLAPGAVHPAYRRRGLGRVLLAWVVQRGEQEQRTLARGTRGCLRIDCRDCLADRVALYERFGFAPIRQFCHLRLDLPAALAPPPALPGGITLTPWNEAIDREVMDASGEIFAAHWASSAVTPASWRRQVSGNPRFRGDLSVIAWRGRRVAGLCLGLIEPESGAASADEAWVMQLGVRADARGQGLATALMRSIHARFLDSGFARIWVSVDTDNPTEIMTLCTKLGYAPAARYLRFSRNLAGSR